MGQPDLDEKSLLSRTAFLLRVIGLKQLCSYSCFGTLVGWGDKFPEKFNPLPYILGVVMCVADLPLLRICSLVYLVLVHENTSSIRVWGSSSGAEIPLTTPPSFISLLDLNKLSNIYCGDLDGDFWSFGSSFMRDEALFNTLTGFYPFFI